MLRVRFSEKSKQLIVNKHFEKNYFELIDTQAIDIFLSSDISALIAAAVKHPTILPSESNINEPAS